MILLTPDMAYDERHFAVLSEVSLSPRLGERLVKSVKSVPGISCTGRARAVGEVSDGTGDDVGYDQADGEVCESPGHLPHHPLMWCHARSARRRHMS